MLQDDYGIGSVVANRPAYLSRPLLAGKFGKTPPISEAAADRMISVSLHPAMSDSDNAYIAAAILDAASKLA
jgi:dTDP-4-amino-4,6-dideoxygalactose transaminase